jgi:hypothetical protein
MVGPAKGGIQKMRSKFFEKNKGSGVAVTAGPTGCRGECFEFKKNWQLISKEKA